MRIERKMVAGETQIIDKQQLKPRAQRARNWAGSLAPEQPVMYEQYVGIPVQGTANDALTHAHGTRKPTDVVFALDLKTVQPRIAKAVSIECRRTEFNQCVSGYHDDCSPVLLSLF